jgi:hypothetical protein
LRSNSLGTKHNIEAVSKTELCTTSHGRLAKKEGAMLPATGKASKTITTASGKNHEDVTAVQLAGSKL